MKKAKFIASLLGASAAFLPFLSASQANAAVLGCNGASNSNNFFDVTDIPVPLNICTLLDGTSVSWGTRPTLPGQFQFQKTGSDYLLTFSPDIAIAGSSSGSYTYTLNAASGYQVAAAQSNTTLSLGNSATTNTLSNANMGPVTSTGGTQSAIGYLSPKLSSATFTSTYNVAVGENLAQIADKFAVTQTPRNTPTPSPLPLFGAGAAFGFSRRLRNRVKLAA